MHIFQIFTIYCQIFVVQIAASNSKIKKLRKGSQNIIVDPQFVIFCMWIQVEKPWYKESPRGNQSHSSPSPLRFLLVELGAVEWHGYFLIFRLQRKDNKLLVDPCGKFLLKIEKMICVRDHFDTIIVYNWSKGCLYACPRSFLVIFQL